MEKEKRVELTHKAIYSVLNAFSNSIKDDENFISEDNYKTENFFEGTKDFLKNAPKKAKWSLGYCNVDLTPLDYAERNLYMGGYISPDNGFKNLIEEVVDSMQGRAIALCDGTDRGINLFCTVDCIGITNGDIRIIRKKFCEKFYSEFPDKKLCSVNIFSTHTHSCVDTEGLWTEFPSKLLRNLARNRTGRGVMEKGADEQYMRFLCESVSNALMNSVRSMAKGEMYLAKKDIGEKYFKNKNRPSAPGIVTDITRLTFVPDDKNLTPTIIVNLPAHPDVAGLPLKNEQGSGRRLTGDYVYYMGDIINKAGYNFMFFNGAICAIYMCCAPSNDGLHLYHRYEQSQRFGRELGRIALSLTKTEEEIEKDKLLYNPAEIARDTELSKRNGNEYTLWCENWECVKEEKVSPIFNIRLKEVKIPIKNPLLEAAGKLRLANYTVMRGGKGKYSVYTEIGYMEIGNSLKICMVPGEFCCDLLVGGASLYKDGSVHHKDFPYPHLRKIFGEDTIAFGLANDEIGYIVPDNDYTMGDPMDHYHELVSLGYLTGSSIMKGFCDLAEELGKI